MWPCKQPLQSTHTFTFVTIPGLTSSVAVSCRSLAWPCKHPPRWTSPPLQPQAAPRTCSLTGRQSWTWTKRWGQRWGQQFTLAILVMHQKEPRPHLSRLSVSRLVGSGPGTNGSNVFVVNSLGCLPSTWLQSAMNACAKVLQAGALPRSHRHATSYERAIHACIT